MTIKRNRWTKEELAYLKANYGTMPNKKLAKILGRTINAVQNNAGALNLTQKRKSKNKSKKVKKITLTKTFDKTALATLILVTFAVILNLILLFVIGG